MSEFFVGQIMMSGFSFAPKYWAQCNGQIMAIQQNMALFALLGTRYGGNGSVTFGLPDLRGRVPVAYGPSADPSWQPPAAPLGQLGGTEAVTLLPNQLPPHGHEVRGVTTPGDNRNPTNRTFASTNGGVKFYAAQGGAEVVLAPTSVAPEGGSQAHPNMQPYTTLNFCVALSGIFPPRS
ncbi:phage tail protein [Stenotrophomonas oahuensis]|uniref:Tail fiber protein n=1 Tax=Stenotrophomonas oahuensis TaxID=3003271 RepID=A0ABY9YPI1_9GAMM|nr:tail fiber protein [Stenotrophomonas sp. A5586]WNH52118.1 tail fiber protein [Stenotrophomonas sp. A5586]